MKPACMDPAEYALWSRANAALKFRETPCHDCPMSFALEMRAEGRCDGEPAETGRPRLFDPATEARRAQWRAKEDRRRAQWRVAQRRRTVVRRDAA